MEGCELDQAFGMAAIVEPGYSGGKGRGSWWDEFRLEIVDRESRFWRGGPVGVTEGDVKSFASSWIDGSLVASDVRRETGGERYPSSPLDGRRSSLDATVSNGLRDHYLMKCYMMHQIPNYFLNCLMNSTLSSNAGWSPFVDDDRGRKDRDPSTEESDQEVPVMILNVESVLKEGIRLIEVLYFKY